MSICRVPYFAGLADCKAAMRKVVGVGITEKGTTFTKALFLTESTWHTGIASSTTANRTTMMLPLLNYERTTSDPGIQESNLGKKLKDLDPAPSMQGWLEMSPCDYQTLFALEGVSFDIVLFLQGGIQMGSLKSDGTIKGFRATISLRKDLPPSDNAQASYPVDIFFSLVEEFDTFYLKKPDYSFNTLLDFVAAGLAVSITTAIIQATGVVVLQVNLRCTDTGVTGLEAADFEVLASNGDAIVSVTSIVDDGLGQYTVTIKDDTGGTPGFMSVGKYYIMQVSDDDSTYITQVSQAFKETILA